MQEMIVLVARVKFLGSKIGSGGGERSGYVSRRGHDDAGIEE